MEKLDNKTFDPPEEFKLKCVLSSIKQYAEDHSLTATQIEGIFHEGILASFKAGKIQISSYSDDNLPISHVDDLIQIGPSVCLDLF